MGVIGPAPSPFTIPASGSGSTLSSGPQAYLDQYKTLHPYADPSELARVQQALEQNTGGSPGSPATPTSLGHQGGNTNATFQNTFTSGSPVAPSSTFDSSALGALQGATGGGSGAAPATATPAAAQSPVGASADASAGLNLDALRPQPNGYVGGQPGQLRPFLGQKQLSPDALSLTALQRKAY